MIVNFTILLLTHESNPVFLVFYQNNGQSANLVAFVKRINFTTDTVFLKSSVTLSGYTIGVEL